MPHAIASDGAKLYYEVHGHGPFLFLGPSPGSRVEMPWLLPRQWGNRPYLAELCADYSVILMDQMRGSGRTDATFPPAYTPEIAAADLLAVADAAGAKRFAWFGFSWGAVLGIQLAIRTDRISALLCGGWAPLDGAYQACRDIANRALRPPFGWLPAVRRSASPLSQYYGELSQWSLEDQRRQLANIQCPRLLFIGSDDSVKNSAVDLANRVRQHEGELRGMGWQVQWIPQEGHQVIAKPKVILPIVRSFLDPLRHSGRLSELSSLMKVDP